MPGFTSYRSKPHLVSLGLALLVVAAIGTLSFHDWQEFDANARAEVGMRTLLDQTQQLVAAVTDAETGQRGYLLTGDEQFLLPYQEALARIQLLLPPISQSAGERANQNAARLVSLARARLAGLAENIQIRRGGDIQGALAHVRAGQGREDMNELRRTASAVLATEQRQLQARGAMAFSHQTRTRLAIIAGMVLLALLLLGAGVHIDRLLMHLDRARDREHQQKALLETTLRSIGDAVIATDASGIVTFCNPIAGSLTGWDEREARGQPLASIFPIRTETTRELAEDPVAKVLRLGAVVGLANHTVLSTKDGREIPIDDTGAPIRDEMGRIIGVVLVFRDVTARRQAQRELAESENRYRLLFENNPQPMWVYHRENLRFLAVNRAAVAQYGYTEEQFLAMTLLDIRPAEDIPALLAQTARPVPAHTALQWRHKRKDGSIFLVETISHPLEFAGAPGCFVMVTDVTERQKLKQQLEQSQRLESIGRLAGGVAHDFNNLLTVINGYTDMLLDNTEPGGEARECLEEIHRAAERAAGLTQQLLAFSRRQLVQPVILNMNQVVSDMEKMLRRLIGEDLELVCRLSPDLGNVMADPGQMQQVVMNLAVNARDAMPRGGRLVIETSNMEFDEAFVSAHPDNAPGPHILLAVSDSGVGMTEEVKNRLFEPFFTTKPVGAGTGLGLATVYGMVKQSGGSIWVYSEPGHGTTFKIYLPIVDAPVAEARSERKPHFEGHETLLIVEDQTEVRTLAVSALEHYGYRILSAASGAEALDLAEQFNGAIHLLVTDVVMPGLDGRELAARLLARRPDTRVLYMSGYTDEVIAHRGVLDPAVALVQKPFTAKALAQRVRQVLDQGLAEPRG